MSITIEIYPRKVPENLFETVSNIFKEKYTSDIKFKSKGIEVNALVFKNDDNRKVSFNTVIAEGCKSLFVNVFEIEKDIMSATEIVEGLKLFKTKDYINQSFVDDFKKCDCYFSIESMASRGENEMDTMLLLAKTLSFATAGLMSFTEGAIYFNKEANIVYSEDDIYKINLDRK
nr:hypothetical protein [Flavobacterium sp. ASV13]